MSVWLGVLVVVLILRSTNPQNNTLRKCTSLQRLPSLEVPNTRERRVNLCQTLEELWNIIAFKLSTASWSTSQLFTTLLTLLSPSCAGGPGIRLIVCVLICSQVREWRSKLRKEQRVIDRQIRGEWMWLRPCTPLQCSWGHYLTMSKWVTCG